VAVARPALVVIFYATAWILPESGAAAFADDIYGEDAVLERALERRPVER
jgi:murein L,D-transpeptidase YcbB/YkuD